MRFLLLFLNDLCLYFIIAHIFLSISLMKYAPLIFQSRMYKMFQSHTLRFSSVIFECFYFNFIIAHIIVVNFPHENAPLIFLIAQCVLPHEIRIYLFFNRTYIFLFVSFLYSGTLKFSIAHAAFSSVEFEWFYFFNRTYIFLHLPSSFRI